MGEYQATREDVRLAILSDPDAVIDMFLDLLQIIRDMKKSSDEKSELLKIFTKSHVN